VVKRIIDIILSLVFSILSLPVCIIAAIAIKLEGGKSVFYLSQRIGLGGRKFNMIKFRTMDCDNKTLSHEQTEQFQQNFKLPDDMRITKVGNWLRRNSFDEIPQFINVLKGDMSVIGPRPKLPEEIDLYNNNRTYTKGFNLVGNPYPSPINWNAAGWTKTNIDDALYFFKASGTDQYGGSYSSYVNGNSSDGVANAIIPSMQGFFVRVSTGTYPVTATLGFSNNVRVTNLAPPFFKSAKASAVPLIRITATFSDDPLSSDPTVIYFDENGTEQMDPKLDALKLFNTDLSIPNLYSVTSSNDKLSISALPPITGSPYQVPLGIKANRTGTINIKLKDAEEGLAAGGIFFTDIVTGVQQDMLSGNQYSVYLPSGEYLNRFFLKFGSVTTSVPVEQRDEKMFKVFNSNGVLKVVVTRLPGGKGDLLIFNILGQQVFSSKIYETGSYDYSPAVNEGIYIVTFVSGKERISQKLYIGAK